MFAIKLTIFKIHIQCYYETVHKERSRCYAIFIYVLIPMFRVYIMYLPISMFSKGLLTTNVCFRTEQYLEKMSFLEHIAKKFRRPTIPQLNIEGLTASKLNVLHYLALQFEAEVDTSRHVSRHVFKNLGFGLSLRLGPLRLDSRSRHCGQSSQVL